MKKLVQPQPQLLVLVETISAITVTDGGFGYTANTNPTVLLSQETITREQCNTVNISGDYGVITTAEYKSSGP